MTQIITEYNNEVVKDEDELSELLSEEFTGFLDELWKDPEMTREATEDDGDVPENCRMYTRKAQKLIDNELQNLHAIGAKYYPDGGIDISSHMYQEY